MKVFLSDINTIIFLFPDASRIEKFGFVYQDKKIVYVLKSSEKVNEIEEQLSHFFRETIIVTQNPSHAVDVTLNIRSDYVKYLRTTFNLPEQKSLEKKCDMLSEQEFLHFLKMTIVLRRWYKDIFSKHEKVYKLFQSIYESKKEFISLYVELRKHYSEHELFSSMLTFLERITKYEDQKDNLSEFYRGVIRIAKDQGMKMKQALVMVSNLPSDITLENRLIGFYLSLKD